MSSHRPNRLKISLLPPFTQHRYLLPIPDSLSTTSDLKRHIVQTIPAAQPFVTYTGEVIMEVEGFEVIDGPLGLLRENDVVW